ncbi:hypothetical protein AJ79_02869 [Helicocarpus griseus UAMH5409]|uniref:Uncharacterized protein n=1 Tax=Helicocarpus griseus UAMH5409 TaxID=1447875 RepID=A0A2B7Y0Y9_9EURO|nr:hypothetical protein AJ79_02869 [Helicocarpus griseus UAMH5409]
MSALSSPRADSLPASEVPVSYQQVQEGSSSSPERIHQELEDEFNTQQYIPQPDASDDGTYETEDGSLSDSGSNKGAPEVDEQDEPENSYASSEGSSISERPNKYRGPPSTWRAKTRQERQEINSLETLRARDLSIHLFNAFALKRRARGMPIRNSEHNQEFQPVHAENDDLPSRQLMPTKQWTAWPLPADEVPRGDEHVQKDEDDIWTVTGPSDGRPSAELEDCIMAQMLRTAKERFESREWDTRRSRSRHTSKGAASETDGGATSTGKEEESGDDMEVRLVREYRPVVQADDEKSTAILRPAARHILSDLDNILMGLHHSRQAYVTTVDQSQSEYDTEAEEGLTSRSVSRSRATSRGSRSRSRGIKRRRNSTVSTTEVTSEIDVDMELSDTSHSRSRPLKRQRTRSTTSRRSRSRSPGSRQSKLGLRDWSDVIGIALMGGLPPSVVMRTAKRCSELFGEDMAFRTLREGKLELNEGEEKTMPSWGYFEDEGSGESSDPEISKSTNVVRRRKRGDEEILCPVKGCSRSTKGFSRTWNLNQHLKNKHPNIHVKHRRRKSALSTEESG